jgi:hypothetical protein
MHRKSLACALITQLTLLDKLIPKHFQAINHFIKVIMRACSPKTAGGFSFKDLSTTDYSINQLTGIAYAGVYKN